MGRCSMRRAFLRSRWWSCSFQGGCRWDSTHCGSTRSNSKSSWLYHEANILQQLADLSQSLDRLHSRPANIASELHPRCRAIFPLVGSLEVQGLREALDFFLFGFGST